MMKGAGYPLSEYTEKAKEYKDKFSNQRVVSEAADQWLRGSAAGLVVLMIVDTRYINQIVVMQVSKILN